MAYTSGIFHIDLVSGSDAARTALTSCTASNPSGSITRINKTAHGLTTGAVVDLTLFTAWLNSAWKITVVDADNFDLDDATWQTTADTSGTVTPRGGSSWTDAWLTFNSGATAARIQPGDEIRISKTADAVSLGQTATWTDASQTVTLTTAVTKKIEDAISGWTAATNITAATSTVRKLGATAVQLTPAAGFTTGKMAYAAIAGGGTQDFSGYTKICLWFMPSTAVAFNASDLSIKLCSDATGDTAVNTLNFPATLASANYNCLVLDNGGALSSSVQSVAIYANVDPGTTVIRINNIFAANDLTLKTLIGKSGDVNYNIQSIDDTTIKIDNNNTASTGRGYSGTTESVTTYYRVPFDSTTTGSWATINEAGNTTGGFMHFAGGWDTSANTRNGQTVIASTLVGVSSVLSTQPYNRFSYFSFARFNTFAVQTWLTFENCVFCGGGAGGGVFSSTSSIIATFDTCKFLNGSSGMTAGGLVNFINCEYRNQSVLNLYPGNKYYNLITANNTSGINLGEGDYYGTGTPLLRNCTINESTEIVYNSNRYGFIWSFDHDNTSGNHWGFTTGATINWQTTTKQGSDPGAWQFTITGSTRTTLMPIPLKIAEIAVNASSLVTVKAWVKKDHATDVGAKLYVQDALYNLDGVSATSDTKADDTSWEELTITFTPTQKGALPIFVDAWYVAGASNVYVGSVTVTQA